MAAAVDRKIVSPASLFILVAVVVLSAFRLMGAEVQVTTTKLKIADNDHHQAALQHDIIPSGPRATPKPTQEPTLASIKTLDLTKRPTKQPTKKPTSEASSTKKPTAQTTKQPIEQKTKGPSTKKPTTKQPTKQPTHDAMLCPRQDLGRKECIDLYNDGSWSTRKKPIKYKQKYTDEKKKHSYGYGGYNTTACKVFGVSNVWRARKNENMGLVQEFDADLFLELVGDKTLMFVGDSLTKQHFTVLKEFIDGSIEECHDYRSDLGMGNYCNLTSGGIIGSVGDVYGHHVNSSNDLLSVNELVRTADILLMNFGIWYFEQKFYGKKSNHTRRTFRPHMNELLQDIKDGKEKYKDYNKDQFIIWRESSTTQNPTNGAVLTTNEVMRELLSSHGIPVIRHQTMNLKHLPGEPFKDRVHFCEPAVFLGWSTILLNILHLRFAREYNAN